jgi:uncharacterized membrane protein
MPAPKVALRWVLTVMMVVMGVLHFVIDDIFAQIVPPWLPSPYALVWISGVFEIALGLGLTMQRTRRLAGFGLVALFVAVFPANIYMAVSDLHLHGLPAGYSQPSALALWLRLPLQIVLIAWALWVSKPAARVTPPC